MRGAATIQKAVAKKLEAANAFVVFSDDTHLFWLRGLKKGFRHCAMIIRKEDDSGWLVVDPLSHHLLIDEVRAVTGQPDLPELLRAEGHTLVAVTIAAPPRKAAPFMPLTCVEVVKRLLGIHDWRIITPYQLYRHLNKRGQ